MKRHEYLVKAILSKCYTKKAWIVSAFSLIQEGLDAYLKNPYPYRIVQSVTGHYFVDPENNNQLTLIEDAVKGEPLFNFKERVVVDSSLIPNVIDQIETTIGNILFNLCCVVHAFGTKLPFVTGRVEIEKIEDIVAKNLKDTPLTESERSTEYFYVDEYVKFTDSLPFIESLSQLCVLSATEKTMTKAPGFDEFKNKLVKEYGDTLKDPIKLHEFEKKLQEFDNAYLKGDPADGTFLTGKVKNNARKKMFLAIGAEKGFDENTMTTPITNSLTDGWPKDPEQFVALMNASRAGSFSRGSETIKGGVAAKYFLRAGGNMKIVDTDCGTEIGIPRKFDKKSINHLVGRSIRLKNNWVEINNLTEAEKYIDTNITVRSPMYCKLDGDNICKYCAGHNLSLNPNGISMALTEVSAILLTASLKAMHTSVLSLHKLDKEKIFT